MKQSLYLETSVIGAYLDNGEPFRRDLTKCRTIEP